MIFQILEFANELRSHATIPRRGPESGVGHLVAAAVAVLLFTGTCVLQQLLSDELHAWTPRIIQKIMDCAVRRLPELGATDQRAPQGFAGIAIGLGLTLTRG